MNLTFFTQIIVNILVFKSKIEIKIFLLIIIKKMFKPIKQAYKKNDSYNLYVRPKLVRLTNEHEMNILDVNHNMKPLILPPINLPSPLSSPIIYIEKAK